MGRAVQGELAQLHTTTAWCCHDRGAPARAPYHFGRAVQLATEAGDAVQAASALSEAGMMLVDGGRPNDALKAIQLACLRLLDASAGDDPRVPILESRCHAESACALSMLDGSPSVLDQAQDALAKGRDGWVAPDPFAAGDMHLTSSLTWLHSGQLDAAETAVTRL